MGRYLSSGAASAAAVMSGLAALPFYPGQLPLFGSGQVKVFLVSETHEVAVTGAHRIRVLGGGGGVAAAGQSSSFGALLSATGGAPSDGVLGGAGGIGVGGDFQARGGAGGDACLTGLFYGGGGGAAGSQLGDGGRGGDGAVVVTQLTRTLTNNTGGGGGGVGGHAGGTAASGFRSARSAGGSPLASAAGSAAGRHWLGHAMFAPGLATVDGLAPPMFHFIGGYADLTGTASGLSGQGGYGASAYQDGPDNGGTGGSSAGGVGGGGGGSNSAGGYPSQLGGGQGGGQSRGGCGGGGFAMGAFDLTAGDSYPVTVAEIVAGASTSPGVVILEW